jgi:hypothetical protein
MSHSDFDVITGPSMPQRQSPEPRQSGRSANDKSQPGAPPPTPAATSDDTERKGAAPTTAAGARPSLPNSA